VRVKLARAGRERAGLVAGGTAPFGYRWHDKRLVQVPARAAVVRRVFTEYAAGVGQRGIVRALAADGIRSATGKALGQSAVSRMLAQPLYAGKLPSGEDAEHEAIIDAELWERVQAIRSGPSRKRGGRQPDGGHLLTRGVLSCTCGAAMIPRKARHGVERERYVCAGRIADPGSCSQPSIRRERIDEPFLRTLLDSYVDLAATRRRIEQRSASALTLAREALDQAAAEAASAEARLARVREHYQAGRIEPDDWVEQRPELTTGVEAASEAVSRAREHVEQLERSGVPGDAEAELLAHLADLKRVVASGAGQAPDLRALRTVIGDLFAEVQLVRSGEFPQGDIADDGMIPWHHDVPALSDCEDRYWLLLVLRSAAVDAETLRPMGQAIPVPWSGQYPPGFLARYCWW